MKKVFITGISKGLGKELFEQLFKKGYFVYGLLRNKNEFEELAKDKKENTEFILADISSDDCIHKIQEVVKNETIDLIINNAGISGKETN